MFGLGGQEIVVLLLAGLCLIGVPTLAVVIILAVVWSAGGRRPADAPAEPGERS